ncbi:MAG: sulfatase-like hydrolase/transferase [Nannocystaceae bacterium]|nr:sulfatase-like hydrolase/transferase [Myxococcales bacterium]
MRRAPEDPRPTPHARSSALALALALTPACGDTPLVKGETTAGATTNGTGTGTDATSTGTAGETTTGETTGEPTDTQPSFYGSPPRNLLVLSIDTLRHDRLPRYGGDPETLVFLNSIAEEGYALDQHRSCSNWTFASMLCYMTGATNVDVGFIPQLSEAYRAPVPQGVETLPQWLSERGYFTLLSTSNSWFSDQWNMAHGFQWTNGDKRGSATFMYDIARPAMIAAVESGLPWYFHLHFIEPHAAYNPPAEYLEGLDALEPIDVDLSSKDDHYAIKGMWGKMTPEEQELLLAHLLVRYEGELRYIDDQLAALWLQMNADGLLDDTLVLIITDHGEQFWEHGAQTHGYGFHPEENDALAIFWADNIVPGSWDGPTNHTDLAPTILSLLDIPAPAQVTGMPVGTAPDDRVEFGASACKSGVVQSVQVGDRKLQYSWWGDKWYYRHDLDPLEAQNLYDPQDPDVVALWELLLPEVTKAATLVPNLTPALPGP